MAGETVYQGLTGLTTVLMRATVSGEPALSGGWVAAEQYASIPQTPKVPFILTGIITEAPAYWDRFAVGGGIHHWQAEFLLPVAVGFFKEFDKDAAAAEVAMRGWPKAVADQLWADQTLDRNAEGIGFGLSDAFRLFEYRIGHMRIFGTTYWGMRGIVRIRQRHAQPMG